ncbi:MAG TPA: hypothetical protein ENI70_01760 [Candidatus Peregrinibacteria bacterium]|nr:hypothetical protein [Candidatus Peregrinibacteria bacterium]
MVNFREDETYVQRVGSTKSLELKDAIGKQGEEIKNVLVVDINDQDGLDLLRNFDWEKIEGDGKIEEIRNKFGNKAKRAA